MSIRNMWKHSSSFLIIIGLLLPTFVWIVASLKHIGRLQLDSALSIPMLARTHGMAIGVGIFSIAAATPAALYCRIVRRRYAVFVGGILIAPLFVGMLSRNYAWIGMLSGRNASDSLGWSLVGGSHVLYTPIAVYLVMTFVFVPWAFSILQLALAGITNTQLEAARTLGASPSMLVQHLLGPALLRGALLAFLLIYCSALGYFITPKMVGGNRNDLAGNVIIRFIDIANFSMAAQVALALLATTIPSAVAFLWLTQWRYRLGD